MKILTIYEADDGTRFDNEVDCKTRDTILKKANGIMSNIYEKPNDSSFVNGSGYVQHNEDDFEFVKKRLLVLFDNNYKFANDVVLDYISGRANEERVNFALSNTLPSSLYRLWSRILNTDSEYREWGQYCYKLNPSKAKNIKLNRK